MLTEAAAAIAIPDVLGELALGDLLVVTDMAIDPAHRGQDLAVRAVQALVSQFGSRCRYVLVDVRPHHYSPAEVDAVRGLERLQQHFARVGARLLPTAGFMLIDLEDVHGLRFDEELPSIAAVRRFEAD